MLITAEQFQNTETNKSIVERKMKSPYVGTPMESFHSLSSKAKGKFFEELVQELAEQAGASVSTGGSSDYDRLINGQKIEIKGSFLWGEGTHFRWQQLRPHQNYDKVVFVAAYPDRVEFYEADKATVKANVEVQDNDGNWIYNQHGGKKVNSGTFCIDGFPGDFPWMKKVEKF
jgi:hypothetical protein